MFFKEYFPNRFSSKYIDSYFTIDTSYIENDITDLIYPDGTFGLLFIDGENSIRRNNALDEAAVKFSKSTFFGQKTKPINYYYSAGNEKVFGLKIKPEGLPFFINNSSKYLKNQFLNIDCIGNKSLLALEEKILESHTIDEKIATVECYISKRVNTINQHKDYVLFSEILKFIKQNGGLIRFKEITKKFNSNYKKIERLFGFYLGITPKTYMRIVRFNNSLYLYNNGKGNISLTQLGYNLGFFDQSHFIKEFKSFTAITPSEFFNKDLSDSEEAYLRIIHRRHDNGFLNCN